MFSYLQLLIKQLNEEFCHAILFIWVLIEHDITAEKMKFSIKDFFSKYDKIRRKLRILSHLLKKSLMENFIFGQCIIL